MKKSKTINFMPYTLLAAAIGMNIKNFSYKLQVFVGAILIILAISNYLSQQRNIATYLKNIGAAILLLLGLDIVISSLLSNVYIQYSHLLSTYYYKVFEIMLVIGVVLYCIIYIFRNGSKDEYEYVYKSLKKIVFILILGFMIIFILYLLKINNLI